MSLNSYETKEVVLHFVQRLWLSMLEITEWPQKPERARPSKRTKSHRHGIELSPATKVVKRHAC
jgi:hypothetical protein